MQKRAQVVTALVIGLLVGAAATYALAGTLGRTSTTTTTLPALTNTTTETVTQASVTVSTENVTLVSSPLLANCPTAVQTPWFGTLDASNSPVTICFQVYEFNSTSEVTLNTTDLLSITGYPAPHGGAVFSGIGNFTVSSSVDYLSIGGPDNANEGTIVAYTITSKPGASGTYFMQLAGGYLLGGDPGETCTGGAGELVAGNGQPNYALPGNCITHVYSSVQTYTIPGVTYQIVGNYLYYRIYGVGNSTR